jgi:hypothetical protein
MEISYQGWLIFSTEGGVFCQKANFGFLKRKKSVLWKGQFWPKFSQNLPFYRIIEIGLKTGIFDPFSYKVAMEKTNFLRIKLFFGISSSIPLQWLSSKKLMECLKGQRFQFLGMFQWFCEKANFGYKGKSWLNFAGVPENWLLLFQAVCVFKFSRLFFFLFHNQIKWLILQLHCIIVCREKDQPLDLVVK